MGVDESEYSNTAMERNLLKTQKSFAVLSNGKYIGDSTDKAQVDHEIEGLNLADKILI